MIIVPCIGAAIRPDPVTEALPAAERRCLEGEEGIVTELSGTHAATFGGNPLACAAALASLKVITGKKFLEKSNTTATYFMQCLKEIAKDNPVVKEVRGKGMFLALELNKPGGDIVIDCMKKGFLINCIQLNVLRFLPPLNISRKEIDSLIPVLTDSLAKLSAK